MICDLAGRQSELVLCLLSEEPAVSAKHTNCIPNGSIFPTWCTTFDQLCTMQDIG
jgi:hypothetical protein